MVRTPMTGFAISDADRSRVNALGFSEVASIPSHDTSALTMQLFGSTAEAEFVQQVTHARTEVRCEAEHDAGLCAVLLRCGRGRVTQGPVVIASALGTTAPFEVWLGAAVAVVSGRHVVHLNANGEASTARNGARSQVRELVRGFSEQRVRSLVHGVRELATRPATIVVQAEPDVVSRISRENPQADVICVLPATHLSTAVTPAMVSLFESAVVMRVQQLRAQLQLDAETQQESEAQAASPNYGADRNTQTVKPSRVRASDALYARLTDQEIELVNRTDMFAVLEVTLGAAHSAAHPDTRSDATTEAPTEATTTSVLNVQLAPGETRSVATQQIDALRALQPPTGVQRSWSHSVSTVFSGGDQAIQGIYVSLRDIEGVHLGGGSVEVPNGLDRVVSSRELTQILAYEATPVLPEPHPRAVHQSQQIAAAGLFGAVRSGFEAAQTMLQGLR